MKEVEMVTRKKMTPSTTMTRLLTTMVWSWKDLLCQRRRRRTPGTPRVRGGRWRWREGKNRPIVAFRKRDDSSGSASRRTCGGRGGANLSRAL